MYLKYYFSRKVVVISVYRGRVIRRARHSAKQRGRAWRIPADGRCSRSERVQQAGYPAAICGRAGATDQLEKRFLIKGAPRVMCVGAERMSAYQTSVSEVDTVAPVIKLYHHRCEVAIWVKQMRNHR